MNRHKIVKLLFLVIVLTAFVLPTKGASAVQIHLYPAWIVGTGSIKLWPYAVENVPWSNCDAHIKYHVWGGYISKLKSVDSTDTNNQTHIRDHNGLDGDYWSDPEHPGSYVLQLLGKNGCVLWNGWSTYVWIS